MFRRGQLNGENIFADDSPRKREEHEVRNIKQRSARSLGISLRQFEANFHFSVFPAKARIQINAAELEDGCRPTPA